MNRPDPHPTRLDHLFDQTIDRHRLLVAGDAVLVAVSGGPDSTALLHLLLARVERLSLRLGVGHLDHGLRPESSREALAVERLAGELGVAAHLERTDVRTLQRRLGTSVEAAGREARYDFFRRTAERHGYTKVALGHHADDNAETLLLNLLRGSGRSGLGGIRAVRDGIYIRPLLRAFRPDIEAHLRGRGVRWLSDASNTDVSLRRNRIRHHLIPLLERDYQPAVRAVLSRAADVLAAEEAWIGELLQPLVDRLLQERAPGCVVLDAAALAELPVAVRRRVVRAGLRRVRGDLQRIGWEHVERVLDAAGACHLPGGVRVSRTRREIVIERVATAGRPRPAAPGPDYEYRLAGCGTLVIAETGEAIRLAEVPPGEVAAPLGGDPFAVQLDAEAVQFPLTIRNRRPGDRFHPLGAGGSQKLKKYFGDHKVGPAERICCPLLLSGERIVWVAGHRLDERARITPGTRRVLTAERLVAKP
jgi:tRNA(Ile)-lysidine synthase